jgi:transcriptional regulator GlxA family with amidase domain
MTNSVGGMAPSTLRRCIALMEPRLEGDLGLVELASEAGLSTSHFNSEFPREHREDALSIPA